MALQLPPLFVQRMQDLLGDEFQSFMDSYQQSPHAGIRINTLKITDQDFQHITPFALRPIPWCPTGYYVEEGTRPGKHPYYHAGLYYIQEPSAMAPVEALDVQPGDRVLDLCAAPGGKSTQIAAALQGQGILVTNDISADRTKALAKNMELYGVRNAVVLNETPEHIAEQFAGFFNKILVDAPCSGEGMFRKDEDMARQWVNHSVERCAMMQQDILNIVAKMLAPGGRIVYSTCTFAPEENERSIAVFLDQHAEFQVTPLQNAEHFAPGHSDWAQQVEHELQAGTSMLSGTALDVDHNESYQPVSTASLEQTAHSARLWPHLIEGEGHYICMLDHQGEAEPVANHPVMNINPQSTFAKTYTDKPKRAEKRPSTKDQHDWKSDRRSGKKSKDYRSDAKAPSSDHNESLSMTEVIQEFTDRELNLVWSQNWIHFGGRIYQSPITEQQLKGLKVVRPGWFVGTIKNGRFTPSHALATALQTTEAKRSIQLQSNTTEAISYLKGETLTIEEQRVERATDIPPKGYVLVCIDGYSVGWGKWLEGMLKNEYPAGWRWT